MLQQLIIPQSQQFNIQQLSTCSHIFAVQMMLQVSSPSAIGSAFRMLWVNSYFMSPYAHMALEQKKRVHDMLCNMCNMCKQNISLPLKFHWPIWHLQLFRHQENLIPHGLDRRTRWASFIILNILFNINIS